MKLKKNPNFLSVVVILSVILFYLLPFLIKPTILTNKDNDLGRNYVPMFNFFRQSIYQYHQIPLWRPEQMLGESFVHNPISSLFYPVNIIFLVFPVKFASVIYYLLHLWIAGISTYFLARTKKLSKEASIAAGIFYSLSTKMLLHISAGHLTMIASFAYFPLAVLCTYFLFKKPRFIAFLGLSASLTFTYFTYPTIFYYTVIFLGVFWFYLSYQTKSWITKKSLLFVLAIVCWFGLSAITLLPHLELGPLSTRQSMNIEDVAQPVWNFAGFFTSLTFPYPVFNLFNHEAFLYLGVVPTLLAIIAFFKLKNWQKIFLGGFLLLTLLYMAGLSTPVFPFFYNHFPLVKYSRITTRLWFTVILVVAILAASVINKIKSKKIIMALMIFYIAEVAFIGYTKTFGVNELKFNNIELYEYLSSDKSYFRTYCATYCFNPQLSSQYGLQLLNGETPIQVESTVKFLAKAGNYKSHTFAVIFPPYQLWQTDNPPHPKADLLGQANVKYIASTYEITDKSLISLGKFDQVYLYLNKQFKNRFYFLQKTSVPEISQYTPNSVTINLSPGNDHQKLIFAESYFPGWQASVDGNRLPVSKYLDTIQSLEAPSSGNLIVLEFMPQSFIFGASITIVTISALLFFALKIKKAAK